MFDAKTVHWFHEPQILEVACWVLDHRQDRPVQDLEPKSGAARRPVFGSRYRGSQLGWQL